ncbi:MAG: hypothetical protein KBT28_08610, partial [Bacteroidales bacterium]|nr:hypothetical protein [Candidatus Colimorpha merdihippi]
MHDLHPFVLTHQKSNQGAKLNIFFQSPKQNISTMRNNMIMSPFAQETEADGRGRHRIIVSSYHRIFQCQAVWAKNTIYKLRYN